MQKFKSDWASRVLHNKRLKWAVLVVGAAIVAVQWIRLMKHPGGDFHLHWELGRRICAGEFIYNHGTDAPYPPFWALAHAPLSVLSMHAAQVAVFPMFLGSFVLLVWTLNRLTQRSLPLARDPAFWATVAAAALASRFLIRDMIECGVNLALVALTYLSVWLWTRRREWLGGASLGLAIALKCTPALFLAWFVYKRQWKMALASLTAAAVFTLAPALLMGPALYKQSITTWTARVSKGLLAADPAHGVLDEEAFQNISLKLALARYLTVIHTTEHIGRPDHPWYVDVFDLPHPTANIIIQAVLGSLLLTVGWCFRGRVTDRDDPGLLWECAGLSVLLLLFSPITWGQHCVGVLPALFLICRRRFRGASFSKWEAWALGGYIFLILGLNRGLLGKSGSNLLDSYRVTTIALLLLLAVVLMERRRAADPSSHAGDVEDSPHVHPLDTVAAVRAA